MKINNDKYYTPDYLAKYIVEKTKEIIGSDNITEYIEPSAGGGVILNYLDKPFKAYDIEPEDNRIVKEDFLNLNLDYKKGRCIIGNPPFGNMNQRVNYKSFYKKSIQLGDYIAFILPISNHNYNNALYEFDLVYSEDLGQEVIFTDRKIWCCFNIYKRRNDEKINKRKNIIIKDIDFKSIRRESPKETDNLDFDLIFNAWGKTIGKIEDKGAHSHQIGIIFKNDYLKEIVKDFIDNYDFYNNVKAINSPHLDITKLKHILINNISDLEYEIK